MTLKLALAQLNPTMGDIAGNISKLRAARAKAASHGAHLLMTPELYLCGYPPEDLVLKPSFQDALRRAAEELARETSDGGPALLVGLPWREDGRQGREAGGRLRNAFALLNNGVIEATVFKNDLPNYGPFDEKRVFSSGGLPQPVMFRGVPLGIVICEDMWTPAASAHVKMAGARLLLVPNGSPYETGKLDERMRLARLRVEETGLPLVYVNQVGGQDELVFDGASFALDAAGACVARAAMWEEDILMTHWTAPTAGSSGLGLATAAALPAPASSATPLPDEGRIYHALMLGLRDYVGKNGFPGVVLGLSGGIDSALVAALAVDALGADKTWLVMLPSPYTSRESVEDATLIARTLGCRFDTIPITDTMKTFDAALAPLFQGRSPDTTEENIQARARGVLLMALSNKFGPMVLSTGNKSEMSVGYSTLYGDLCGGFAVLKDLYKTQAYKTARWRNAARPSTALGHDGAIIPERVFTRPPTAELRPDQTDQDTLPPYEVLDDILECLIEKDMGLGAIAARGHDEETVRRVWTMLDRAEYNRRQAPPGVKITRRHLGKDRRYPITNRYREG